MMATYEVDKAKWTYKVGIPAEWEGSAAVMEQAEVEEYDELKAAILRTYDNIKEGTFSQQF